MFTHQFLSNFVTSNAQHTSEDQQQVWLVLSCLEDEEKFHLQQIRIGSERTRSGLSVDAKYFWFQHQKIMKVESFVLLEQNTRESTMKYLAEMKRPEHTKESQLELKNQENNIIQDAK